MIATGTEFEANGCRWRVERYTGTRGHSPGSLGGTPEVACRPLGAVPGWMRRYVEADGTVVWCADSIRAVLSRQGA